MNNNEQHIVPIELLTKFFAQEANAEELAMVEEWKNSSSENRKEFDAIEKLWNITDTVSQIETIDLNSEWDKMKSVVAPEKSRTITLRRIVQIAAAILIISGLSFIGLKQSQITSISSSQIALSDIELPDGSIISLNAHSKISYSKEFGKTNREVSLKGEGFFEVTKNTELPFIVKAHEASIEVVGTRFNVKAYKNQSEVKVTVSEGVVKLSERKQPVKKTILTAGETGTYDRRVEAIKKKPIANTNDYSWKTRIIRFNNTPLSEVIEILSNTYQLDIEVTDEVKDCAITVEFVDQDLASVLKVLKSTLDLKIRIDGNKLFISGDGC